MTKFIFSSLFIALMLLLGSCDSKVEIPDDLSEAVGDVLKPNASEKVLLLTIDGGGIKGVLPATILAALEDSLGLQLHQVFDYMGGTSTGGILSMGLSSNKPDSTDVVWKAKELLGFYENDCSQIFVSKGIGAGTDGAEYFANSNPGHSDAKGVEIYLRKKFGDNLKLSQTKTNLSKPAMKNTLRNVFTTCYIVNSSGGTVSNPTMGKDFGPYLFSWDAAINSSKEDYYVWEATRGTSAAPTYFPIAHIGGGGLYRSKNTDEKWVIDGGTMTNNPTLWGVSEIMKSGAVNSLDDIIVVSLGCGLDKYDAGVGVTNEGGGGDGQNYGDWGSKYWGVEDVYNLNGVEGDGGAITTIMAYANQFVTDDQMSAFFTEGVNYFRLQPTLPKKTIKMDDCKAVDQLKGIAKKYIEKGGAGYVSFNKAINVIKANK